jgi:lysylphosphatidylglycerol synthetase-like protein (DUF2156 family)
MDFGISIFASVYTLAVEVAATLARLVAALLVGFVELIILVIEMALILVGYFWSTQKRQVKLSEDSRFTLRLYIYALLTIMALGAVIYFFAFREPKPQPPPPPSKIEKARRVIEKFKEMLPPKSPP